MKQGNIILASIPQSNGEVKIRLALILCKLPLYNDFLVCGISSNLNACVKNFDEVIFNSDDDFISSGLKQSSVIRLGFLGVLPTERISGSISSISKQRIERIIRRLSNYLIESLNA